MIAEEKSTSVERVLSEWKKGGIRNVRFELPDMHGTSRTKIVPIPVDLAVLSALGVVLIVRRRKRRKALAADAANRQSTP